MSICWGLAVFSAVVGAWAVAAVSALFALAAAGELVAAHRAESGKDASPNRSRGWKVFDFFWKVRFVQPYWSTVLVNLSALGIGILVGHLTDISWKVTILAALLLGEIIGETYWRRRYARLEKPPTGTR